MKIVHFCQVNFVPGGSHTALVQQCLSNSLVRLRLVNIYPAIFSHNRPMAQNEGAEGPQQRGRGVPGQYVYWITFANPSPESMERLGLQPPSNFTRESFGDLVVKAHRDKGMLPIETACFLEQHANGQVHHNCLIRCQFDLRGAMPQAWPTITRTITRPQVGSFPLNFHCFLATGPVEQHLW